MVYVLLFLWFLPFETGAQTEVIQFEHLTDEEGLPNNLFREIIQDHDGLLWMVGIDGMVSYDGHQMISFRHINADTNSLSGNNLTAIFEDSKGRLWVNAIGTGINVSDPGKTKFRRIDLSKFNDGEDYGLISEMTEDAEGNIWMASQSGLYIVSLEGDQVDARLFTIPSSDTASESSLVLLPLSLLTDSDGTIWIGTANGLYSYHPETKSFYMPSDFIGLPQTVIQDIQIDRIERLWVSCQNTGPRLFYLEPGAMSFKGLSRIPFMTPSRGISIAFDLDNRLWASVFGEQVYGYDFRDSTLFLQSSLNSDIRHERFFRKPFVDHSGNTWLPCEGFYIYPYPKGFKTYLHPYSFHQSNSCLYGDGDFLWIGYREKGIVRINSRTDETQLFTSADEGDFKIPVNHIQDVLKLKNGHFVLVGFGNVAFLDAAGKLLASYPTAGSNRAAYEDSHGRIWIGGFEGLYLFSESPGLQKVYSLPVQNGESRNFIQSMLEDEEGNIWFASDLKGLGKLNPTSGQVTQIMPVPGDPHSLPSVSVVDMAVDRLHQFWLATDVALVRFIPKTGEFKSYDRSDGLNNDYISAVICTNDGKVWMSTHSGVSAFDPESETFTNYGPGNGLANISYYTRSKFYAPDGTLYFGGRNGVDYFKPKFLRKNPTSPLMLLSGIMLKNNQELAGYDWRAGKQLNISYNNNLIEIEFEGIHFADQEEVTYAYKMEGLHDEWVNLGHKRQMLFSGLQPGHYAFKAKAMSSDGVWSEELSLPIYIVPPFYLTLWFKILSFLLIFGGIVTWVRLREIQIKKRQKLESDMNQKLLELEKRALHAQMNPHFIFNSMNSIQQFIIVHDVEGAMKYLTRFSRILRSVLNISSQSRIPLVDEIKLIEDYLELENMRFPDKFSYAISVAPEINIHAVEIPPFFIQPQVENAIRHGLMKKSTPGHIRIDINQDQEYLRIIVEDNGIGRVASNKDKPDEALARQSMGLSIVEERLAHMHHQNGFKAFTITDLYDSNHQAMGTRVEIVLPLD